MIFIVMVIYSIHEIRCARVCLCLASMQCTASTHPTATSELFTFYFVEIDSTQVQHISTSLENTSDTGFEYENLKLIRVQHPQIQTTAKWKNKAYLFAIRNSGGRIQYKFKQFDTKAPKKHHHQQQQQQQK